MKFQALEKVQSCNQHKKKLSIISPEILPLSIVINPSPKPQHKTNTNLFSVLTQFAFLKCHIKGIKQCIGYSTLSDTQFENILPRCSLSSASQCLLKRILHFNEYCCIIFFLYESFFGVVSKKYLFNSDHNAFSSVLQFKILYLAP